MSELLARALPLAPAFLVPVLLLLLAPVLGRRARALCGVVLLLLAGALAGLAVLHGADTASAAVVNFFPRGEPPAEQRFVTEQVTAPGWQWPLVAALGLLLPALLLIVRRGREPRAPAPVLHGLLIACWVLLVRLGLEKTAAPEPVAWLVGVTPASVLIAPFLGAYCGARGRRLDGYLVALLLFLLLLRVPILVWSYLATTRQLGTHLDVHAIADVNLWSLAHFPGGEAGEAWLRLVAIPQLVFSVLVGLPAALILGLVPFLWARRRHAARPSR